MKTFPEGLHVKYRTKFPSILYKRVKAYLRRELYEHIISSEETQYFDIDSFDKKWFNDVEKTKKMVEEVRQELHDIGWKTDTSFGGTGLFIYAENKPRNCFPDGF